MAYSNFLGKIPSNFHSEIWFPYFFECYDFYHISFVGFLLNIWTCVDMIEQQQAGSLVGASFHHTTHNNKATDPNPRKPTHPIHPSLVFNCASPFTFSWVKVFKKNTLSVKWSILLKQIYMVLSIWEGGCTMYICMILNIYIFFIKGCLQKNKTG